MKIGQLAEKAGVTRDSIRHYVAIGLLNPDRDPENGYQVFNSRALSRLKFIKAARRLGFYLDDVRQVFADADPSNSPCPRVRELMIRRIAETREAIAELTRLCEHMESVLAEWDCMPDSSPTGNSDCRLIESQMEGH